MYNVPCGAIKLSLFEIQTHNVYNLSLVEGLAFKLSFAIFRMNMCSTTGQCLCGYLSIRMHMYTTDSRNDKNNELIFCGKLDSQVHMINAQKLYVSLVYNSMRTYYLVKLSYVAVSLRSIMKTYAITRFLYHDLKVSERAINDVYMWKIRQAVGTLLKFNQIKYQFVREFKIIDGPDFRRGVDIALNKTCVISKYFLVTILSTLTIGDIFTITVTYRSVPIDSKHISITSNSNTHIRIHHAKSIFQRSYTFDCPMGLFPSMMLKKDTFIGTTSDGCAHGGFLLRIAITRDDKIVNHGPYCDATLTGLMRYMTTGKRPITNYYNQITFYGFKGFFVIILVMELSCSRNEGIINPCSLDPNLNRKYNSGSFSAQFLTNNILNVIVFENRSLAIHLVSSYQRNCGIMVLSQVKFMYRAWQSSNRTTKCDGVGFKVYFNALEKNVFINRWYKTFGLKIYRDTCFIENYLIHIEMRGLSMNTCLQLKPQSVARFYTHCGSITYPSDRNEYYIFFLQILVNSLTDQHMVDSYTYYNISDYNGCEGNMISFHTRATQFSGREAISITYSNTNSNIVIRSRHVVLFTLSRSKTKASCHCFVEYYTFRFMYPSITFRIKKKVIIHLNMVL